MKIEKRGAADTFPLLLASCSGCSPPAPQAITSAALHEPTSASLLLAGMGVLGMLALRRHRG